MQRCLPPVLTKSYRRNHTLCVTAETTDDDGGTPENVRTCTRISIISYDKITKQQKVLEKSKSFDEMLLTEIHGYMNSLSNRILQLHWSALPHLSKVRTVYAIDTRAHAPRLPPPPN